jgi:A/G-specific adenine glycosylase
MAGRSRKAIQSPDIAELLLAWYDRARRDLPWRYAPGTKADPYRVWLSEIMLQQTTVKAVVPYFESFTTRWPRVQDLAAAPLDDVLSAWAGLGYYSRARNLHAAAQAVVAEYDGAFPADEAALRGLPGVGPYTAAAIAAIGHGLKATPVDGNIERVVSRLFAVEQPLPAAKPAIRAKAETLTPDVRAGDFAQAMMDLGATICTPKGPSCLLCPLTAACMARAQNIAATLPRKAAKPERPTRYGVAFVVRRADRDVLLQQRVATGLLGGMHEVPSTPWTDIQPGANAVRAAQPVETEFITARETVVHVFTHFRLELEVRVATVDISTPAPKPAFWAPIAELESFALPSVMLKVLAAVDATPAKTNRKPPRHQR